MKTRLEAHVAKKRSKPSLDILKMELIVSFIDRLLAFV
jgi:hypothetical protein